MMSGCSWFSSSWRSSCCCCCHHDHGEDHHHRDDDSYDDDRPIRRRSRPSSSWNYEHVERCGCVCPKKPWVAPWFCCSYPNDGGAAAAQRQQRGARPSSGCRRRGRRLALVAAQCFMLLGLFCSCYVLVDCRLVYIRFSSVEVMTVFADMFPASDARSNVTRYYLQDDDNFTGLGFFFFETAANGGSCAFDVPRRNNNNNNNHTVDEESNFQNYMDFTEGWQGPRTAAVVAALSSIVLAAWLWSMACCACKKVARIVWVMLVLSLATVAQCATLFVLATEFCKVNECYFGRTAGFAVSAMVCFGASAGTVLQCSRNYYYHNHENDNDDLNDSRLDRRRRSSDNNNGRVEMSAMGDHHDVNSHGELEDGELRGEERHQHDGDEAEQSRHAASLSSRQVMQGGDGVGDAQEISIDPQMLGSMAVPTMMLLGNTSTSAAAARGSTSMDENNEEDYADEVSASVAKGTIIVGGG